MLRSITENGAGPGEPPNGIEVTPWLFSSRIQGDPAPVTCEWVTWEVRWVGWLVYWVMLGCKRQPLTRLAKNALQVATRRAPGMAPWYSLIFKGYTLGRRFREWSPGWSLNGSRCLFPSLLVRHCLSSNSEELTAQTRRCHLEIVEDSMARGVTLSAWHPVIKPTEVPWPLALVIQHLLRSLSFP